MLDYLRAAETQTTCQSLLGPSWGAIELHGTVAIAGVTVKHHAILV
jgi:hypothetical protein